MPLTNLQLVNINGLINLLSYVITDDQYDHMLVDNPGRKCAAGHAFDYRVLFYYVVPPTRVLNGYDLHGPVQIGDQLRFARQVFGIQTWENAFSRNAFDGTNPEDVTRSMVIERLKNISARFS